MVLGVGSAVCKHERVAVGGLPAELMLLIMDSVTSSMASMLELMSCLANMLALLS